MIVDRFYYNQLSKQEQAIYRAFYKGAMEHQDVIPIPVKGRISKDAFNRIFQAMTRDNPLIYHLNQSAFNWAEDMFGHTALCPQYFFSKEKVKEYNRKIEKAVNGLAGQLHLTEGTDYEKEIKVHDWFCQNVTYDEKGTDTNDLGRVIASHNIIGVFAHHRGQCEGIAKAVKVILNAVDVKCIVVTGEADGNGQTGPHAWNIVNLDGVPYQLDVTWDIGAVNKKYDRVPYDYFNITDGLIGKDHKADFKLPICDRLEQNYFMKNKMTFKQKSKLLQYVEKGLQQGEKDFYFSLEGKLNPADVAGDISHLMGKVMAERGSNAIKIHQIPNDTIGTLWIGIN